MDYTRCITTIFCIYGCVPLREDGSLKEVQLCGKSYRGKSLYDALEGYVRKGFFALDEQEKEQGKNIMWCIWQHPDSPLFGKDKMATFERYFIEAKETHLEKKNPYYELLGKRSGGRRDSGRVRTATRRDAHIVNGHVPSKIVKTEKVRSSVMGKFWSSMEVFPGRIRKRRELQGIPLSTTPMVLFWLPMSLLSRKRLRWKREAIFIRITW